MNTSWNRIVESPVVKQQNEKDKSNIGGATTKPTLGVWLQTTYSLYPLPCEAKYIDINKP